MHDDGCVDVGADKLMAGILVSMQEPFSCMRHPRREPRRVGLARSHCQTEHVPLYLTASERRALSSVLQSVHMYLLIHKGPPQAATFFLCLPISV